MNHSVVKVAFRIPAPALATRYQQVSGSWSLMDTLPSGLPASVPGQGSGYYPRLPSG